jgi:glycosyltransferase involved in cell wall biosynthesis
MSKKTTEIELSIVMPCLNEADTLKVCIIKAQRTLKKEKINGEIIIADNGSTDGSQEIAKKLGVRLVTVSEKGYGSALMGGITATKGTYVIMGDADDSYDFQEIGKFVKKLREGYDLVQGCRLPGGGGTVMPGAMPFLHRWWGNPMFTFLARKWFKAPINDIYCGLRGFRKDFYVSLDQQCTGMEFATEMIIKSSLRKASIAEVPITLHPDGRKAHAPHLKTFRDGWRTLRFFYMFSPRWLFLIPGTLLVALGIIGYLLVLLSVQIGDATFGANTLLVASTAILCGYQTAWLALYAKVFAINERLMPPDPKLSTFFSYATLEKGIVLGTAASAIGILLILQTAYQWFSIDFGALKYDKTLPGTISGITLFFLGFQTIFSSFFVSLLGIKHK